MAQKRKRNKKWVLPLVLVFLAVVTGIIVCFVLNNRSNSEGGTSGEQESNIVDKPQKEKESAPEGEEASPEKKKVEQFDGDDPNSADSLSGVVTYAGVNGGSLMVRVNIDQYLEGGECGLTLNRGGTTIYSSVAEIVGGPSTASCAGFDVPFSEIGSGEIEIIINLKSDDRKGTIRGEANI